MLDFLLLVVVVLIPGFFWFFGKRWFGESTHPAALFLLALFAAYLVVTFVEQDIPRRGTVVFLWVVVNFAVLAIVTAILKKRRRPGKSEGP